MTLQTLQKRARYYRPIFSMDRYLSMHTRRKLLTLYTLMIVVLVALQTFAVFGDQDYAVASLYLLSAFWLVWMSLEMFYNSLQNTLNKKTGMTVSAASVLLYLSKDDATKSFMHSRMGRVLLVRLGISDALIKEFIKDVNRIKISMDSVEVGQSASVTLSDIFVSLVTNDPAFQQFLFAQSVQMERVKNVAHWIEQREYMLLQERRWWSQENLFRIPSVGTKLSFGRAYLLEEFALPVIDRYSDVLQEYFTDEINLIEKTLIRSKEANALIVGDKEDEHIIPILEKRIASGNIHPLLEHKQLFVLDTEGLIAETKEKAIFEQTFIRILSQIISAGNIILVIPDFPGFVKNALSIGAVVPSLLDMYLASRGVQILAFAEKNAYHQMIEPNSILRERFENIISDDKDIKILRAIVENYVTYFERRSNVFFTYDAIDAVVTGVERYFVNDSLIDEVSDILVDIRTRIEKNKMSLITEKDVYRIFEEKTGIPTSDVSEKEKETLLNLEEYLHKRVIGQDTAIVAIASALRRARSGISNPKRPIGSFLFMGPTGVGKTETTKALTESFFGDENKIMRLDMSEYKTEDALGKLIGSFESDKPGILTSMLRENPYGVLLLDEFEKTHQNVLDVFLQIIDEGIFTDMRGEKVNARNTIIVATSNAGSELIWEYSKKGDDVSLRTKEIIDSVIREGVFKPELVNRFDGVIVFHPLNKEHFIKIADIMVRKLAKRVREKGIDVRLSEDAKEYLVECGASTEFGARELNRVIQNTVEKKVAELMLEGRVKGGDVVTLSKEDIVI